jgi:hypothetical protein
MPYLIADTIFSNWGNKIIAVPSIGSRAKIVEFEGWGRVFDDPSLKVFMREFKTDAGELTVWFQHPDFHRMDVSSGDTLIVYSKERASHSVIECIRNFRTVQIKESLTDVLEEDTLYGEIHPRRNPRRSVSFWYLLERGSDPHVFTLKTPNYLFYPIEWLELNGNPTTSFQWRRR